MAMKRTGNAEIDQQHTILENILEKLSNFCPEQKMGVDAQCTECDSQSRQDCATVLASLYSEVGAFIVGHHSYEEKMMQLLPNTPKCQNHISRHKHAHELLSKQLNKFKLELANETPLTSSEKLHEIVSGWLGYHIEVYDAGLVKQLTDSGIPEIDLDDELVAILDEYVFQNRPTTEGDIAGNIIERKKYKLEIRGRYESLSQAQRKVLWLVASGKKNKEIASELGVSVNTIKTHRTAVFRKMEVRTALELVKCVDLLR
jgi:hemerythrin-like metal-binding protein